MWRTIITVVIVVFMILLAQIVLAPPLEDVEEGFNSSGDYSNEHFDGNERITSIVGIWYNMGLIAIAGLSMWGVWRVVRRERTRGRGGI